MFMDLIEALFPILTFMAGAAIGEFISHKTFGSPKNKFVLVVDVIFFVFIVSAVTTYLQPKEIGLVYYATNFFIGFLAIPIIRGVESLVGLTQKARFSRIYQSVPIRQEGV